LKIFSKVIRSFFLYFIRKEIVTEEKGIGIAIAIVIVKKKAAIKNIRISNRRRKLNI
jgi:hypothetical protein